MMELVMTTGTIVLNPNTRTRLTAIFPGEHGLAARLPP